jgi:hypothetical protein
MRRIFAMLLVSLFSFSLISPAVFASDGDSSLPACCRRAGKHHCTMMTGQSTSSSGPSIQADRCPFFAAAMAIPANQTVSLFGITQVVRAGLFSHPASRPQTEALCQISYSRSGQKRGPPIFLS